MGRSLKRKRLSREALSQYFLLGVLLSFFGWCFEVLLAVNYTGNWVNPGAFRLPICPIYGISLCAIYFLVGTPDAPHGILRGYRGKRRWAWYLIIAFLLPTAAELTAAVFFDRLFGVRLWDYRHLPFNLNGYVSAVVSFSWMLLIFLFMKYMFTPIKQFVFSAKREWRVAFFALLLVLIGIDVFL